MNCRTSKPDPNVLTQRTGNETILLNLTTNHFYSLSPTASRFWELLSAGRQIQDVEQQMLLEFDVDPAELSKEIDSLLANLGEEALVCNADD